MSDLPAAQKLALEAWAARAIDAGWLPDDATDVLQDVTTASPAQLFTAGSRPLVAGLFGGTGVGKSTLLNRLAGESIARTSAERPTSRDITVYVHRSLSVDRLPESLPMERMRTALHNNDQYRHVLFIDMPDFDSVESANRDLVNLWLPHLDVVLYVVSPERYRDDQGWRLLLRHAHEHAWLFIMNHWDRADPAQLDDFRRQLAGAGLDEPLIFRCDSSTAPGAALADSRSTTQAVDDFDSLQRTLQQLADQSIIESLDELGILARMRALRSATDPWLAALGSDDSLTALSAAWQSHWQRAAAALDGMLAPKALQLARLQAASEGSWLDRLRGRSLPPLPPASGSLVDETLLTRLDNALADFLNNQSQNSRLPLPALKQTVDHHYARARRDFSATVDDELTRSLAQPGSRWQRKLHKGLGFLCFLLPLIAMGWIGWRVVAGFAEGGSNPAAYLGSNFAINGSMLLALAWLVPAFLHRKLRPSLEKAALRGVEQGLQAALAQIGTAVGDAFEQLDSQAQALRGQYQELWHDLAQAGTTALPEQVRRMLASEISAAPQRVLDVRANTHNSTDSAPVS